VKGQTVEFAGDGEQPFGAVTDNGDGTYGARFTSTTTAGSFAVTASAGGRRGQATLRQTPGPVTRIAIALEPSVLAADGVAQSTATATATDANGNPVAGRDVAITTTGRQAVGQVSDRGDGTYTATITATTIPGTFGVRATDGATDGTAMLRQSARSQPPPSEAEPLPTVRVLVRHRGTLVRNNRTRVALRCIGASAARCAGSVWLNPTNLTRRVTGASAPPAKRFAIRSGKTAVTRVALSAAVTKRLRARGRTVVWCVVRMKAPGGRATITKRQLTLVLPRPPR
jgi:hypothetical protein